MLVGFEARTLLMNNMQSDLLYYYKETFKIKAYLHVNETIIFPENDIFQKLMDTEHIL